MTEKIITWFEIPVKDIEKSVEFYNEVFGTELQVKEMDGKKFGMFPGDPAATGGAIVEGEGYVPSEHGKNIFFEAGGKIDAILERVGPAGGEVIVPQFRVNDEIGDIAIFADLDGNRIGLHSQ